MGMRGYEYGGREGWVSALRGGERSFGGGGVSRYDQDYVATSLQTSLRLL